MDKVRIAGTALLRPGGEGRNKPFNTGGRLKGHTVDVIPGQGVVLVAFADFINVVKGGKLNIRHHAAMLSAGA